MTLRTVLVFAAIALLSGCTDAVDIANRAPAAELDAIEGAGSVVDVYYTLTDLDGDDVDIQIRFCSGGTCSIPTAASGGDGTANLPTIKDEPVLHLFRWDALCDLDPDSSGITVRITPSDADDSGQAVVSDSFSLADFDIQGECPE